MSIIDYIKKKQCILSEEEYDIVKEMYKPSRLEKTLLYMIMSKPNIRRSELAKVCKRLQLSYASSLSRCLDTLVERGMIINHYKCKLKWTGRSNEFYYGRYLTIHPKIEPFIKEYLKNFGNEIVATLI